MIHKCDQCGQSFTENHNLTRHIQSKHADVKYSCDKCNFQATRKDSLNRHIKSKHAKSSEKFIEQINDDPIADAASEFWQPWKNKPEKRKNSDTFIDQNSFAAEEPEKKKRRDKDNRNENEFYCSNYFLLLYLAVNIYICCIIFRNDIVQSMFDFYGTKWWL